ncbi:hypothetical protein [Streptomyces beihaiensis]|uniref:Uncharacterized protein n=1 Tax=Streptomyces beihaiensis TaxID=2984495 RepID=A0ABT3TTI3_9ACTN|nr:hypothetical protein [Streptomyces beihaiensis]MCX3060352.1 hypothetical protein [Streptomyces beihaiensis]
MARQPALSALSAIVHSESADIAAVLELPARGMRSFGKHTAMYWSELLETGLEDTPARETWRELEKTVVTYFPGRGAVFEEAYLDGEAKGVLRILELRGLAVSDDVRERITSCADIALLDDWLDRAGTVERAEDLFSEGPERPVGPGGGPEGSGAEVGAEAGGKPGVRPVRAESPRHP